MKLGLNYAIIQQLTGINAIVFYSNKIFKATLDDDMAIIYTFFVGVIFTIAALMSGKLMDRFGRRNLSIMGAFTVSLCLFALSSFKSFDLTDYNKYIILIYIFCFGVSLGPVMPIYLSEILPEQGVSIAILTNWLFTFIIGLLFPKLVASPLKLEGSFFLFAIFTMGAFFYFKRYLIETKGKSNEEINKSFAGIAQLTKYQAITKEEKV